MILWGCNETNYVFGTVDLCALNLKYLSCRARGNSTSRGRCRCDDLTTGMGDCLNCVYYGEADYAPLRLGSCLVQFNLYTYIMPLKGVIYMQI